VHQQFAEAFAETANDKVLLHCRSGNRVGMMWSMYQISQGIEAEQAIAEGRAMGMKPKFEEAVRATL
ncbi:MAG: hypothetical protein OIF35_12515, partial [Cellvibrionaceae bacterium]|nr:hypothetical protein [Cellvibrionaceae bacterium]